MLQEFVQEIEATAKAVVNDIHTAIPGEIMSFNSSTGLATIQPKGKYQTADGTMLEYPTITDVPVVYPFAKGCGVGIAYPVKKGDSCLVIVSEIELDEWRSGAESEAPLRFDLTSAIIIPGLIAGGTAAMKKSCSQNAVVITAGASEIAVSEACIAVSGSVTVNGDVQVNGSLNASKGVTGAGIVLQSHTHGGVTSGGGSTSGPQ